MKKETITYSIDVNLEYETEKGRERLIDIFKKEYVRVDIQAADSGCCKMRHVPGSIKISTKNN